MTKDKAKAENLESAFEISVITDEKEIDALNSFFEENDLEISDEEPVETSVVKAWKAEDSETRLIGGVCLAFRQGEYIIDGIAVDSSIRGKKLGEKLLTSAIKEVKKRGGTNIYLVARAPEFFKKEGFEIITAKDAPFFYECGTCPQYNVNCFPEVMKKELK